MRLRVLIVDDTIIYRKIMSDILSECDDVEVAGVAAHGDIALKKMTHMPVDLVFCDVYMPQRDGVQTLAEIKNRFPGTTVVMMSSISTRSADITIKALEMGALDFIRKPDQKTLSENKEQLKNDVRAVLWLVRLRRNAAGLITEYEPLPEQIVAPGIVKPSPAFAVPFSFAVVTIGVSTGGPEALNVLIPALPKYFPLPVLLVQHMPAQFTKSLAESLAKKSRISVVEAQDGQKVFPSTVYIAPGGHHMMVHRTDSAMEIGLNREPPENSCRPSVDVLFRSVAAAYDSKGVVAVILTGMGNDGVKGVRVLKRQGCYCITQSEQSCVVYGMPRAVYEGGFSDTVLPINAIAEELCKKARC